MRNYDKLLLSCILCKQNKGGIVYIFLSERFFMIVNDFVWLENKGYYGIKVKKDI